MIATESTADNRNTPTINASAGRRLRRKLDPGETSWGLVDGDEAPAATCELIR
ncbi:MAG TPA: hypothetical protein VGP51_03405 [Nocardioidaceae bacterium]|nr:hypothetical protein [Actinomycetota bacterium]HEV8055512.1 hypothetical protein [Nocardioidaceae bacterium]